MSVSDLIKHEWDENTTSLVEVIFSAFLKNNRVAILVEPGEQEKIIQRTRQMVSRKRKLVEKRHGIIRPFKLGAEHFKYTGLNGKRAVCIVFKEIKSNQLDSFYAIRSLLDEN